jgi:nucleoporin POM152
LLFFPLFPISYTNKHTGNAPFDIKYEEHAAPVKGQKSLRKKELNAALGAASIQLETQKSGEYTYKFIELSDSNYDHATRRFTPLTLTQRVNSRPEARFTHPGKTYSFCTVADSGEETIPITLTGIPPFHLEVEIRHGGVSRPESIHIPNIATTSHTLRIPQKYLHQGHSYLSIRKVRDSRGCQSKPDTATPSRVQISVHDPPTITPLEAQTDYCVGDYLNFRLSGSPPFTIHYTFKGKDRRATSSSTQFRRIADESGIFTIASISDSASECRAQTPIVKTIHPKPRGTLSKGRTSVVDIHEGGETELIFDFVGTPPFEFTYIRSENVRGKEGQVLETKTEVTGESSYKMLVGTEGAYELVSLQDAYCLSSKVKVGSGKKQKLLT